MEIVAKGQSDGVEYQIGLSIILMGLPAWPISVGQASSALLRRN